MDATIFSALVFSFVLAGMVYFNQRGDIHSLETALKQEQAHSDGLAIMLEEHDVARTTIADVLSYAQSKPVPNRRFALRQRRVIWGYVYLMSMNDEYHKIGYARNVKARLSEMQVSSPYKIKIIHVIATGNAPQLEVILQNRFADKWVGGEWFKLSEDDISSICSLNAAVTLVDLERMEADRD